MNCADTEWSRHHRTRAGHDFRDAIWLDGHDDQSVWGYDTGVDSFFAQLWTNGSESEDPELWLTPPLLSATWPYVLVPPIVAYADEEPLAVVRALGIARPAPELHGVDELAERRESLLAAEEHPYLVGELRALDWMLGHNSTSPSTMTLVPCGECPTAAQIDAEATLAAGMLTITGRTEWAGVEAGLFEALQR